MFVADTLNDISLRLRGSFRAVMPESEPWSPRSNLLSVLKVLAQAVRALQLRLEILHKQKFVSYADAEYLDLHATENGLSRNPATYAEGNITVATSVGTTIPAGSQLSSSTGILYETTGVVIATTVSSTVPVRAVVPGLGSNIDVGATLTFTTPISGTGTTTVAAGGIQGGADEESDDSLRDRILYRKRNPPRGGSPSEYHEWTKDYSGRTRSWVQRATPQAGSVTIYFAMDDLYADGVPTAADAAAMQDILEGYAPADADVNVEIFTPLSVDIEIDNLTPDTAAIRDGVQQELAAAFYRRAIVGQNFSKSWLSEAISSVPGWKSHVITDPEGDVTVAAGELPVLGTVTFV